MTLLSTLFFVLFAAVAIVAALGVVLLRNAVYSALSLVGVMVALAGIFLLMNAELVAAIQIIVYAGAIVVLFLFVIMMLNLREPERLPARNKVLRIIGTFFGLALLGQMAFAALAVRGAAPETAATGGADFVQLAGAMITQYVLPFELISVLLLAAIIGAIVVSRREIPEAESAKSSETGN